MNSHQVLQNVASKVDMLTIDRRTKSANFREVGMAKVTTAKKVNGMTLAQFRAQLPAYRRMERFMGWDVAKGYWLAQQQDVAQLPAAAVQGWAKSKGLDRPYRPVSIAESTRESILKLGYVRTSPVDDADLANIYGKIELARPLLFGTLADDLNCPPSEQCVILLDGHHRLRKAFLERAPLLYGLILSPQQTTSILIR